MPGTCDRLLAVFPLLVLSPVSVGAPGLHVLQAPYCTQLLILEMKTQMIKCTKSLPLSISCKFTHSPPLKELMVTS